MRVKANLIIALCAILISIASFYATYLQANAAEMQVKAMTLPLMDFKHGNYNEVSQRNVISFTMSNSGMGPAIVHKTRLFYKDMEYASPIGFLMACCSSEYKVYESFLNGFETNERKIEDGGFTTNSINQVVIPAQSERAFFKLYDHQDSHALWQKVNKERWELEVEFCFCNLLDDCFVSRGSGFARSVKDCKFNRYISASS